MKTLLKGYRGIYCNMRRHKEWWIQHSTTNINLPRRTYCTRKIYDKAKSPSLSRDTPTCIDSCFSSLSTYFRESCVDEPACTAGLIVAHAMGYKMINDVPRHASVTGDHWQHIIEMAEKRANGQPVQYVLGEWEFLDMPLVMRPPVFIPRPETEQMAKLAWEENAATATRFIEIGTGSGAISLWLLRACPWLTGVGVEQGAAALSLTRHNAEILGLSPRLRVVHEQFSAETNVDALTRGEKFDFLISNPPYIPRAEIDHLPVEIAGFEDEAAYAAGEDGMDVIRDILQLAPLLVKPEGSIWLEVDASHPTIIEQQLPHLSPWLRHVTTYYDVRGWPRIVHLALLAMGCSY